MFSRGGGTFGGTFRTMQNLSNSFHTHLEAKIADSKELIGNAYQVRYKVYCVERGYEDRSKFPDKMEKDEFDGESVHAVVRHKSSKSPVGVVRLVLPNKKKPKRKFPIEMHFGHQFEGHTLNKFQFSRCNIAEVSRFAVSKQSLRHIHERLISESIYAEPTTNSSDPKHLLPHISLGLIAMLFAISHEHGISYWYAAMEPSLSRLLTRLGIEFTPIGPIMEYHGRRQPMIAKVSDLLENIQHSRKDFFKLITDIGDIPVPETREEHGFVGDELIKANSY